MDLGFWTFAGTLAIGFILGAGTLYGLSFLFSAEDETLLLIQGKLNSIEQIGREILNQMANQSEAISELNSKLDLIDQRTTDEAAEIKAVVDELKALAEGEKFDAAAFAPLLARLDATAENVKNIYSASSGEVGEPVPVEEAPTEPLPEETEEDE